MRVPADPALSAIGLGHQRQLAQRVVGVPVRLTGRARLHERLLQFPFRIEALALDDPALCGGAHGATGVD